MKIVNTETGVPRVAVSVVSAYPGNAAEKDSGARLVFKCADSGCALAQVWTGTADTGMQFSTSSAKRGEPMRLAAIALRPANAD